MEQRWALETISNVYLNIIIRFVVKLPGYDQTDLGNLIQIIVIASFYSIKYDFEQVLLMNVTYEYI